MSPPLVGVTAPSQDSGVSTTGGSLHSENSSSLPIQITSSEDSNASQWSPVPTSVDPNRPDYSTPTSSPLPAANDHGGNLNTAALVGITISAVVIVLAVVITIIWWTRTRSKNCHGFGSVHGQQRRQQRPRVVGEEEEEEEEKPPTYEAAVFGIYSNSQTHHSLQHILSQQPPPAPLPQVLPQNHYLNPQSSGPLHTAALNRTLPRLDTTVSQQDIPQQRPDIVIYPQQRPDIVIYPHDSPPQTPTLPEQNPLSIRPTEQVNQDDGNNVVSHHITDFPQDYPDTISFNSDFSDDEPASAAEIV